MLRSFIHGIRRWLFPGVCNACGLLLHELESLFCEACRNALVGDTATTCPRCCTNVGVHADVSAGCPRCRDIKLHFESAFRLGYYDGVLRDAILKMKNIAGESLAYALGRMWAEHHRSRFEAIKAQFVIPIPLHWTRRWVRGYNQSETLALAVAEELGLPCCPSWLRRVRNTPHQTALDGPRRVANMKDAFRCSRSAKVQGARILLIDDVLTTGATLSQAAKVLGKAGASVVVAAVLAHR